MIFTVTANLRSLILVASLGAASLAPQAPGPGNASQQKIDVRCGAMWDGKTDQLQHDVGVTVEGGRVTAVGVNLPKRDSGAIDLTGQTCLPGLIDTHTHVFALRDAEIQQGAENESVAARTIRAITLARKALDYGFTSIRDLHNRGVDAADADLSRAIARGVLPGPRMQVATSGLSVSGAISGGLQACDGPDECRRAVRQTVARGANWIKVFADRGVRRLPEGIFDDRPTFTLEALQAIVDEAHRLDRRVAAHASGKTSVHTAVQAGVDSVEHGMYIAPDDLDAMRAKGMWYVPSLYLMTKAVFRSAEEEAQSQAGIDIIIETFRRALHAGVKIAFGSDAGAFDWNTTPAIQLPLMVKDGMTPVQALRSATVLAAELLQTHRDVGTIEPGKFADIIAVSGDPLTDMTLLQKVSFVMKGGVVYRSASPR